MGKKVFEVAKELGVDHRELLKCDALNIDVRNYMSVLSEDKKLSCVGLFKQRVKSLKRFRPGVVVPTCETCLYRRTKPVGLRPRSAKGGLTVIPTKPTPPWWKRTFQPSRLKKRPCRTEEVKAERQRLRCVRHR